MSRPTICDSCGATKRESFMGHEKWLHHYSTGKDECYTCLKKREKAEDLLRYNRIRASVGLPDATDLPKDAAA